MKKINLFSNQALTRQKTAIRSFAHMSVNGSLIGLGCFMVLPCFCSAHFLSVKLKRKKTISILKDFATLFRQVINNFECMGGECERAVLVEMGVPHKVMLFPNGTATYNSKFVNMPKTVDKTIGLETLGVYTVVRLLSGKFITIQLTSMFFLKFFCETKRQNCMKNRIHPLSTILQP